MSGSLHSHGTHVSDPLLYKHRHLERSVPQSGKALSISKIMTAGQGITHEQQQSASIVEEVVVREAGNVEPVAQLHAEQVQYRGAQQGSNIHEPTVTILESIRHSINAIFPRNYICQALCTASKSHRMQSI